MFDHVDVLHRRGDRAERRRLDGGHDLSSGGGGRGADLKHGLSSRELGLAVVLVGYGELVAAHAGRSADGLRGRPARRTVFRRWLYRRLRPGPATAPIKYVRKRLGLLGHRFVVHAQTGRLLAPSAAGRLEASGAAEQPRHVLCTRAAGVAERLFDGAEAALQPGVLAAPRWQWFGLRPDGFGRRWRRQRLVRREQPLVVHGWRGRGWWRRQVRAGFTFGRSGGGQLWSDRRGRLLRFLGWQLRHPVVDRYRRSKHHGPEDGCRQRTTTGTVNNGWNRFNLESYGWWFCKVKIEWRVK